MHLQSVSPRKADITAAERLVREDLAAAYRLVAYYGMDDSIYTHISARVPGTEGPVPDQSLRHAVSRHHGIVAGEDRPRRPHPRRLALRREPGRLHHSQRGAFGPPRCRLRAAYPHVAGVAVSSLAGGLQPCNQWALQFYDRVVYHDFEGIALDHEERERLVADLGPPEARHDPAQPRPVTVGRTVAEAFILMLNLERACRVQVAIQSTGQADPSGARRTSANAPRAVRER
jgi:ribulose-5-phosphate 4-epimerase/fuculose-1-phosphate aldolase